MMENTQKKRKKMYNRTRFMKFQTKTKKIRKVIILFYFGNNITCAFNI